MQDYSDIDSSDLQNALQSKGLVPMYLDPTDIDKLAQTIRDRGGFIMGVYGENNGTWLSSFPKKPKNNKNCWAHWLYFGQAKLINGKKYLGFKNSWGAIGENSTGWQYIPEEYLNGYTWNAWTVTLVNPPKLSYTFSITMKRGDSSGDVAKLQTVLKQLGFFPSGQSITNYFGDITFSSVKKFQSAHNLPSTGFVGSLTIATLNNLTK